MQGFWQGVSVCKKNRREITMVCIDEEGRWASMSMAKSLAEAVLCDEHLILNKVTLLEPEIDWDCGGCFRCKFWDRRFAEKNVAVRSMVARWQSLKQHGKIVPDATVPA